VLPHELADDGHVAEVSPDRSWIGIEIEQPAALSDGGSQVTEIFELQGACHASRSRSRGDDCVAML
jgi:hypothetical protein